jgi:hypothetical protein
MTKDVMFRDGEYADLLDCGAAEGLVLVSSKMQPDAAAEDKDVSVDPTVPNVKDASANRRLRAPAVKDESEVALVLRSVYQRAVDEDIPSEMLDLLRKLD